MNLKGPPQITFETAPFTVMSLQNIFANLYLN